MYLNGKIINVLGWVNQAQERKQWWDVKNAGRIFPISIKGGQFLDQPRNHCVLRRDSALCTC
jgi:hypothetical protein